MPFIPHTPRDIDEMLAVIGATSIEQLFDEIPDALRAKTAPAVASQLNEQQVSRLMMSRARQDGLPLCFIGAGAYEHHIPAAVWELATRGEFYTAYTPYQAEASQGTLQLLYEYQTMMASLNGLAVSNASLYDGASALAEAVLMAVRVNRKSTSKRVLMPRTVNPRYRKVVHTLVHAQGIELVELPYDLVSGTLNPEILTDFQGQDFAALVIPQPNFFGQLEAVDVLTDWAHANGAIAIGVVNPLALALLTPPGLWGSKGVDIACGDGQPMGIPLSSGGPYFGFICCRQEHVRQMPGRIIGRTVDAEGKPGFVLTLQAREQHIRRSKATSNICTNQGLMVTAATIHMSLLGAEGLRRCAITSHNNTAELTDHLTAITGVSPIFTGAFFHEQVFTLATKPAAAVLAAMATDGIQGGYDLGKDYPELGNAILVCATETKTCDDLQSYAATLRNALETQS